MCPMEQLLKMDIGKGLKLSVSALGQLTLKKDVAVYEQHKINILTTLKMFYTAFFPIVTDSSLSQPQNPLKPRPNEFSGCLISCS